MASVWRFGSATVAALAATAVLGLGGIAAAQTKRLNVLFVIADDLNTHLGCYGHPEVKTPNIDRLAARGVRFDRAYCQAPVCNPSRASLFSGLLPETTGVLDNGSRWPTSLKNTRYMPDHFRAQGYFTGTIGKVMDHGRVPRQPFWDLEIPEWGKQPSPELIEQQGPGFDGDGDWAILKVEDPATPDGDVARRAAAALSERAGASKPFFLAAGFRRPHEPYAAPNRYFALYAEGQLALPRVPPAYLGSIPAAAWNRKQYKADFALPSLRAYYASISFMDAQLGILLDAMDRNRLWDTTVVVFVSDHGYHTGQHGMWHKQTLFEQGTRVPMIIAAPGKRAGVVCRRVVEMLDLYPTLTELCGLPAPGSLQGRSLMALLGDPELPWSRSALTIEFRERGKHGESLLGRSLRTERFRYTEWEGGRLGTELYDHDRDPEELENLAQNSKYAGQIRKLRAALLARPDRSNHRMSRESSAGNVP